MACINTSNNITLQQNQNYFRAAKQESLCWHSQRQMNCIQLNLWHNSRWLLCKTCKGFQIYLKCSLIKGKIQTSNILNYHSHQWLWYSTIHMYHSECNVLWFVLSVVKIGQWQIIIVWWQSWFSLITTIKCHRHLPDTCTQVEYTVFLGLHVITWSTVKDIDNIKTMKLIKTEKYVNIFGQSPKTWSAKGTRGIHLCIVSYILTLLSQWNENI